MNADEEKVLLYLKKHPKEVFEGLRGLGMNDAELAQILDRLAQKEAIELKSAKIRFAELTDEGKADLNLFPEELLLKELAGKGSLALNSIKNSIALSWAKRNGWILMMGNTVKLSEGGAKVAKDAKEYHPRVVLKTIGTTPKEQQNDIVENNADTVKVLEKRGLLLLKELRKITSVEITPIGMSMLELPGDDQSIGQLTREMILTRNWRKRGLRRYDVSAPSERIYSARLHPMHELIDIIREIWLSMGFIEGLGPIIESAFWNFDVLFAPQDHPTRDMQDTFFLSNPKVIDIDDIELLSRVKKMHQKSWGPVWREEVAKQALLRTHNTSVSAHYIKNFADLDKQEYPIKVFSIGRIFRNESGDYKHLAELYQYDGIIIGDNLTLANLIHTLREFYKRLGIEIGLKPSYFPFVEPGMEIFYFDKEHNDRIELCGAGIIRKEITKALGSDKTVLAWGGGIERLMFNMLKVGSLSDIYKNDIDWLRERERLRLQGV